MESAAGVMAGTCELPILYEDNHLLVVNKPAGMLSQGDLGGDLDVLTVARQFLKLRDAKPGNVYVGLVHRLDRPVAGVMLLAKTSKCAARLSEQFRQRETKKIYLAAVEGLVKQDSAAVVHRLEKDRQSRITKVVSSGGKEARLSFRVVARQANVSVLEIELLTGLPHQIRAQLSHIGHPILGDLKYGASRWLSEGSGIIALYSQSLRFTHPTQKREVTVTAPAPPHWIWNAEQGR